MSEPDLLGSMCRAMCWSAEQRKRNLAGGMCLCAGPLECDAGSCSGYREDLSKALELFRVPTAAMLEAGSAAHPVSGYHTNTTLHDIIEAEWTAMVNEVLK